MENILQQLQLDQSFFVIFGIFFVFFLIAKKTYFQPFQKLVELREQRTTKDMAEAKRLQSESSKLLLDYQQKLTVEKKRVRAEFDQAMQDIRKTEEELISSARAEAKKITSESLESIQKQKDEIEKEVFKNVETLSKSLTDKLLGSEK